MQKKKTRLIERISATLTRLRRKNRGWKIRCSVIQTRVERFSRNKVPTVTFVAEPPDKSRIRDSQSRDKNLNTKIVHGTITIEI